MKIKDFTSFNHPLLRGKDEFEAVHNYKLLSIHKEGSSFITFNFIGQAINSIITAVLMTEDDLPEKINPNDFSFCFLDNKYDNRKSFFICKVDSNNQILESKYYRLDSDFA